MASEEIKLDQIQPSQPEKAAATSTDEKQPPSANNGEDKPVTPTEAKDGKTEEEEAKKIIGFFELFKYADGWDKLLMAVGLIGAAGQGVIQPLISLLVGTSISAFIDFGIASSLYLQGLVPISAVDVAKTALYNEIIYQVTLLFSIGAGSFACAYLLQATWQLASERQSHRIRNKFLASILKQDVSFFDTNLVGDLTTRLSTDTTILQEGISDKVPRAFALMVTFITGFVIAFVRGWQLTLVLLAVTPVLGAAAALVGKIIASAAEGSSAAYAKAGSVAQETLANIRTVTVFNGQERAVQKFSTLLDGVLGVNERKSWKQGLGFGTLFGLFFGMYALAFYYGSTLVVSGVMKGGDILNVIFAIIIGAFSLVGIGPLLQAIAKARGVAGKIYETIESTPTIVSGPEKKKLEKVKGKIEFRNVSFRYPSRPDVVVLKNFNLTVESGTTVALVGFSGSGKSTTIQLLERFYEPFEGEILLDDVPIKDFDLNWLRQQIGLVSQEPVLFDATIEQNIRYGAEEGATVTQEDIEKVTQIANAHDFISKLPSKYQTRTGERGALLSGGQKQRIAIARSLLKNPHILLLDEATSALDSESEKHVQVALENASKNRTTLVIAHRLSTIKGADKIVVLEKGVIVEQGTHDSLLGLNGQYASLVKAQELKSRSTDQDSEQSTSALVAEKVDEKRDVDLPGAVSVTVNEDPKQEKSSTETPEDLLTEEEKKKLKMQQILRENKTPLWEVFMLQRPDIGYVILGVLGSAGNGAVLPLFGLFFGQLLGVFTNTNPDEITAGAIKWALVFVGLMVANFVTNVAQYGGLGVAGERLTKRVRVMAFRAMLRQDISFFDDKLNGTGFLTARLSDEAESIQSLMGPTLGNVLQFVSTLCVALVSAFVHSWKMTLVVLAVMPVTVTASVLQNRLVFRAGGSAEVRKAYAQASQTCCDAISNIRTVKSLTVERYFEGEYRSSIEIPYKAGLKKAYLASLGFAFGQASQYFLYAVAFLVGYYFVVDGSVEVSDLFTSLFSILFGAIAFSNAVAFGPDITKARVAAITFYQLLDRVPPIDSESQKGEKPVDVQGEMAIKDVQFHYPQRTDIQILKGVNLDIKPGQNVALVGQSGSGKSTIFGLVTRFYDPTSGSVSMENRPLPEWNVSYLRNQIAIVSQEPSLFIGSIYENIQYGKPNAIKEEIEEAAKQANIHNFIMTLPEGYQTEISNSKLSGGQKQRISIARALICKPKLLLLDEATSALDSESEKLVQDALNAASKGRTTLTIAHRLSTIQDCDVIVVMREGVIVEQGKHFELIDMNGIYASLVKKQQLSGTGGM